MTEETQRVNDGLSLISYREGLSLGTDTLLLASYIKGNKNQRLAELGTGTGILSMLLASRHKAREIVAAEVQEKYASLAERNVADNHLSHCITVRHTDIREWGKGAEIGSFDAVCTNPPYFRMEEGERNKSDDNYIARHEVYGGISDFCLAAGRLLRYGGVFYTVYPARRLCDLITALREALLEPKRMTFVHPSPVEAPSLVLLSAVSHGRPELKISAPLYLYTDKSHTAESEASRRLHAGELAFTED